MEAPRWLGECGNYLGAAQAGSGVLTREDLAREGITLSTDWPQTETQPVIRIPVPVPEPTRYVPPPPPPPPPLPEAVPVDATVTEYVPTLTPQQQQPETVTVPDVTPDGQVVQMPLPVQTRVATGGGSGTTVVEKEKLPGWVAPALIAAVTMLMGGGG